MNQQTPISNNRLSTLLIVVISIGLLTCILIGVLSVVIALMSGEFASEGAGALLLGAGVTLFSTLAGCSPFILIFGGIIAYILYHKRSRAKVGKPTVTLPTTLRLGEKFEVPYYHTFNQQISCEQFSIQLIFEERATYSQGSDTRTVTHEQVIAESILPARIFQPGDMIADSLAWQIPRDAMHTVKAPRNVLRWLVRLKFVIPKSPDYVDEYEINVLPEIAR